MWSSTLPRAPACCPCRPVGGAHGRERSRRAGRQANGEPSSETTNADARGAEREHQGAQRRREQERRCDGSMPRSAAADQLVAERRRRAPPSRPPRWPPIEMPGTEMVKTRLIAITRADPAEVAGAVHLRDRHIGAHQAEDGARRAHRGPITALRISAPALPQRPDAMYRREVADMAVAGSSTGPNAHRAYMLKPGGRCSRAGTSTRPSATSRRLTDERRRLSAQARASTLPLEAVLDVDENSTQAPIRPYVTNGGAYAIDAGRRTALLADALGAALPDRGRRHALRADRAAAVRAVQRRLAVGMPVAVLECSSTTVICRHHRRRSKRTVARAYDLMRRGRRPADAHAAAGHDRLRSDRARRRAGRAGRPGGGRPRARVDRLGVGQFAAAGDPAAGVGDQRDVGGAEDRDPQRDRLERVGLPSSPSRPPAPARRRGRRPRSRRTGPGRGRARPAPRRSRRARPRCGRAGSPRAASVRRSPRGCGRSGRDGCPPRLLYRQAARRR